MSETLLEIVTELNHAGLQDRRQLCHFLYWLSRMSAAPQSVKDIRWNWDGPFPTSDDIDELLSFVRTKAW